ncbi:hypothetical protein ACT3CD_11420 [Geofilum sp. OHC36d9]|uniref:hypothetical protein n=1 Tax=Geofilum sp. OHC36d9 TaxID=3458413 RepID=UPI0040339E76
MNVLQLNNAGDVSLDAIAVMAQATNEGNIVDGYGPSATTVCDIPGGTCDVSAQDAGAAGY